MVSPLGRFLRRRRRLSHFNLWLDWRFLKARYSSTATLAYLICLSRTIVIFFLLINHPLNFFFLWFDRLLLYLIVLGLPLLKGIVVSSDCGLRDVLLHFQSPGHLNNLTHVLNVELFWDIKSVIYSLEEVKLKIDESPFWNTNSNWKLMVIEEHLSPTVKVAYLFIILNRNN